MPLRPFPVTQLALSASLADAIQSHWKEYLMEAAEMGLLMFSICLFGTLIYSSASPMQHLRLSNTDKASLMGIAVAITTFLIIRSHFLVDVPARTSILPSPLLISILAAYTVGTPFTTSHLNSGALLSVCSSPASFSARVYQPHPFATSSRSPENTVALSRLLRNSSYQDASWASFSLRRITGVWRSSVQLLFPS